MTFQDVPRGFPVFGSAASSCLLSSSDPEETVEWQHGRPAPHVGQGLRGVSSSELQSHAALRQEQCPGAASMSAILALSSYFFF